MSKQFKPAGYNSVSPYVMVEDAQRFIDMLVHIFDAREKRRYNRPDGKIMHAEVQIDDSIVMIADPTDQYPVYQLWFHVYVPDVDETFKKAVEYGCEAVAEPADQKDDPDRRGIFRDFAGNYWGIGTQIA